MKKYRIEFVGAMIVYMLYMIFVHVYQIVTAFKNYINGHGFQVHVYYNVFNEGIIELVMFIAFLPACIYATWYVIKLLTRIDDNGRRIKKQFVRE